MIEFLKKLWASLDTPEGVAVVVAMIWSALIQWAGLPEKVVIPGIPGDMSPAALLLMSVPLVLAKMGWTAPFQPVTALHGTTSQSNGKPDGVGIIVMTVVFAAGLVCVAASPAVADPLYDFKRVAAGADVGVVYAESLDPARPLEPGLRISPYVSASVSEQLSIVGKYGYDVTHGRARATAGARIAVVGFEPEDRVQAGLMFDRVWYGGDGADFYGVKESWAGGVAMSWLAATLGGRDAVYAKAQAAYDSANGYDVSLALGLNFIGGGN